MNDCFCSGGSSYWYRPFLRRCWLRSSSAYSTWFFPSTVSAALALIVLVIVERQRIQARLT